MGYLDRTLGADERVEYMAKTHWIVFVLPTILLIIPPLGLLALLFTWLYTISTELGVTNKRVIGKWGFISRRTLEQRLEKVEGVQVHQGMLGRIFNYGTVVVTGTGGTGTPIPNIADPLSFREAVNLAMDTRDDRSTPIPATSEGSAPEADERAPEGDVRSRLETLEKLHGEGLINAEEFASKRAEIISRL